MATFDQRPGKDGKLVYRARVRLQGYSTQTATFYRLSEARKWAQLTEVAILEGRHLSSAEATRHTVTNMIDRYMRDILTHKRPSSVYGQTYQLRIKAGQFLAQGFALGRDKETVQALFEGGKVLDRFRRLTTLVQEGLEVIHGAGLTGQGLKTLQC